MLTWPCSTICRASFRDVAKPRRYTTLSNRVSSSCSSRTPVTPLAFAACLKSEGQVSDRSSEIPEVAERTAREVAILAVDHGPERVAGEVPYPGCRHVDGRPAGNPGIDVRGVLTNDLAVGIGSVEHAGPIAPLQEFAFAAQAARRHHAPGRQRHGIRGHDGGARG